MDSLLNFKSSLMQAEALEHIKHKIWSPVPHKLRKIEDAHSSTKTIIVQREDSSTSTSSFTKKTSLQSFNPNNSAFRYIFANNNGIDLTCHSSLNHSEKSSPSANDFSSGNRSAMQIEIPTTIFRRTVSDNTQTRLPETPNFRLNINSLREVSMNTIKPISISDFMMKAPTPFTESFLPREYLQLFSALSSNDSVCDSPMMKEKEEHKHKCERHNHNHSNNSNSTNNENADNGSKIINFMKPDMTKKKTRHCNCKNSKCLKLYCECLAYGEYCDDQCNCCDCHNTVQKEEVRNYALSLIAEKKPEILEGAKVKQQKSSKIVRGKGCNCKKSACQKKYCECYNAGGGCGPHCKCEGCKNPYGGCGDNNETDSPISMDIAKELGLNFKNVALSDKPFAGKRSTMKNKVIQGSLSLFGRELSDNTKSGIALPNLL